MARFGWFVLPLFGLGACVDRTVYLRVADMPPGNTVNQQIAPNRWQGVPPAANAPSPNARPADALRHISTSELTAAVQPLIDLAKDCHDRSDAACQYGLVRAVATFWAGASVENPSGHESITLAQKTRLEQDAEKLKGKIRKDPVTDKVVDDAKDALKDKVIEALKIPTGIAKRVLDVLTTVTTGHDPGPVGEDLERALYNRTEKELEELAKRVEDATRIVEVIKVTAPTEEQKEHYEKTIEGLKTLKRFIDNAKEYVHNHSAHGQPAAPPVRGPAREGPGITPADRPRPDAATPPQPTTVETPPETNSDAPQEPVEPSPPQVPQQPPAPQPPTPVPVHQADTGNKDGPSISGGDRGDFHPGPMAGGPGDRGGGKPSDGTMVADGRDHGGNGGSIFGMVTISGRIVPMSEPLPSTTTTPEPPVPDDGPRRERAAVSQQSRQPSCLLVKRGFARVLVCLEDNDGRPVAIKGARIR